MAWKAHFLRLHPSIAAILLLYSKLDYRHQLDVVILSNQRIVDDTAGQHRTTATCITTGKNLHLPPYPLHHHHLTNERVVPVRGPQTHLGPTISWRVTHGHLRWWMNFMIAGPQRPRPAWNPIQTLTLFALRRWSDRQAEAMTALASSKGVDQALRWIRCNDDNGVGPVHRSTTFDMYLDSICHLQLYTMFIHLTIRSLPTNASVLTYNNANNFDGDQR